MRQCLIVVCLLAGCAILQAEEKKQPIPRQALDSKSLASAGYDPDAQILEIEFVNGAVYRYFEVPNRVFKGLMKADSKGGYFHKSIREKFAHKVITKPVKPE